MLKKAAAVLLLAIAGPAAAMDGKGNSSDHFTVGTSLGTAAVSESSSQAPRAYQQARDDALAYVASAGDIHGAQFEQALRLYRSEHPQSPLSDLQVAQAIASQG
ncbi:DUF2388 domain-containing protein [Pseudomonas sp. PDM18]|uniref:DUF2388 domain-containing protein n=1 Tax=Pseudomonas sp. PDM18 TaxID=2769253 RepID=UPI001CE1DF3C|nr:DUF2388 domain-containing protein [Pseudomonas sp. PDM18]